MADKPRKRRFNLVGYGAIALYLGGLAMVAAGVYGFSLTKMMMLFRSSALTREQVRTGHMLIGTDDRTQCRSMHFDNETSALTAEKVMDCDDAKLEERGSNGSYGMFRDGFRNR
jgi:hypothetical protein